MVFGAFVGKAMIERQKAGKLNKSTQTTAMVRHGSMDGRYVPHLGLDEVRAIANAANTGRHGERNKLLIQTLFDACLRVTEGLRLRPKDLRQDENGWMVSVLGKGNKQGVAAISPSLAAQLQAYAYRNNIDPDALYFPISRWRAFQVVKEAMEKVGIYKPEHVGACHVLRHSGAIERLRLTGNPRSVQDQLRHSSARMTLRYLKTLSTEESKRINQTVDQGW